eukprot:TRINITY_DN6080_c0_g1_i6.p1 TRINITY_DN6080_c0_g1~~TRINITY_DN6080_c0_g1_i6.p1  ORF type:complete len:258 (+),score=38.86 TRINITY_DN6080_c0_g1_i6:197-970(+)
MVGKPCVIMERKPLVTFHAFSYPVHQLIASVLVTIGIISSTFADLEIKSSQPCCGTPQSSHSSSPGDVNHDPNTMLIGVLILSVALFLTALLGQLQEVMYKKSPNGDGWKEGVFYQHLFSLPYFVFLASDIKTYIVEFNSSPPFELLGLLSIPYVWAGLGVNVISQYLCICGVFLSTGVLGSFETTMLLTLRKFSSLMISVIYFRHPFTTLHTLGTLFVFTGTLVYSKDTISQRLQRKSTNTDTRKDLAHSQHQKQE